MGHSRPNNAMTFFQVKRSNRLTEERFSIFFIKLMVQAVISLEEYLHSFIYQRENPAKMVCIEKKM